MFTRLLSVMVFDIGQPVFDLKYPKHSVTQMLIYLIAKFSDHFYKLIYVIVLYIKQTAFLNRSENLIFNSLLDEEAAP